MAENLENISKNNPLEAKKMLWDYIPFLGAITYAVGNARKGIDIKTKELVPFAAYHVVTIDILGLYLMVNYTEKFFGK